MLSYFLKTKEIDRYDDMIYYLVDFLAYVRLHYLIIIVAVYVTEAPLVSLYINYHGLFSFSIMEYMAFGYGVYGIWIWHLSYGIASCCIALAYGVMSWTYSSDRTDTASFIGHNDGASYLVGYEGRSSYASMCIHHWFGIEMQLHTLMGMKAGVYVHLYAFLYGFASWMWWSILRYTMNNYVSHCAMAYQILDILYVGCMDTWILV